MSEAKAEAPVIEAGSVDDVIAQMESRGDFELETPEDKQEAPATEEATAEDEAEAKSDEETTETPEEIEPPADEQMISYENDAGEKVEVSLNDALDSHGKLEELTARNVELETQAQTMPEQVKTLAINLESTLGQYQQELETALSFFGQGDINVPEPDRSLLDTDPMAYQEALNNRDKQIAQQTELRQEHTRISSEKNKYTQQLQENYQQEQINEIKTFWPEVVSNKDTYTGVKSFLGEYGFTPEESASVIDSRQMKMVKELMELKADKNKASGDVKKAMKIVRNNPTLVKRGAKAPAQSTNQNAKARLKKSGSIDDAVASFLG